MIRSSFLCLTAIVLSGPSGPASLPAPSPNSVIVRRVPNGGIQPQVLADKAGSLHLLYYAGDPAHGDLYYVKSSDAGLNWLAPLRVNSQPGTAIALGTIRGGQIALGRNGRVYVAWNGTQTVKSGSPLLYARLNDAQNAFEPQRNLMLTTSGLDGGGTIAADAAGHVYVAWHGTGAGVPPGESRRRVWLATSSDDGQTFTAERPSSNAETGACGCCGMAMHSDAHGILRALYRSATQDIHRDIYLVTSKDFGHTFSQRKLDAWNINACPMSSMAFAESKDIVEGAWETGGGVYFENLTNAEAQPVSAPGPGKSHKHPRIVIGPQNQTLLVWTEGTGWNRGGGLAWQLYKQDGTLAEGKGAASGLPAWSFAAAAASANGFTVFY